MAQQPLLDFSERELEVFIKTSAEIKAAIRARIHDVLQAEVAACMTEVRGELEGLTADDAAALFLAVTMGQDNSPKTLLVRECLRHAKEHKAEIAALTHVYHNLHPDPLYRLNLQQVVRYGLLPKTEVL